MQEQQESKDYGFVTTSTARTEATEKAIAPAKAESAQDEHDEISEESATSKESEETLDEESSESDDSDESQDEEQKPKKNSLKKRFSKLTQAKKLAEERAIKAEAMLAQLEQEKSKSQVERPHAKQSVESEGKPKADDFDSYTEYLEALSDWKLDQRESKAKKESESLKQKEQFEKLAKSFDEKVESFKKTHPDFQDAIDEVSHIVPSQSLAGAILNSELGPQIAYELAKNPNELNRINSMTPALLFKEIGKIEARIESRQQQPKTKTLTTAPKPISPVSGGSSTVTKSLSDPDISFAEYEKIRLQQLNKK